jgi:hypothetical protein
MNESKTVKVGSGQTGGESTVYGSASSGGGGGSWEETQYTPPDQPTPRPGQSQPWPPPSAPAQWGPEAPGGAQTIIMGGPKAQPSFAWLVMMPGPADSPLIGRPLSLKSNGTTTLGRVPGNDIALPDAACSGQHAKVRHETVDDGKQVFVIYDLASSNGLYVGNKENYKDEQSRVYRHVLHDGDYLLIGETTLVFKQV